MRENEKSRKENEQLEWLLIFKFDLYRGACRWGRSYNARLQVVVLWTTCIYKHSTYYFITEDENVLSVFSTIIRTSPL
jgi:hypothetical protein